MIILHDKTNRLENIHKFMLNLNYFLEPKASILATGGASANRSILQVSYLLQSW